MKSSAPLHHRFLLQAGLPLLSAVYFVALSTYFSEHRMMWSDEFDGWNLLTDPSWRHLIQSWIAGADDALPLFYAACRSILAVFGAHPLAIRLFSAFCIWSAGVIWWSVLRQFFSNLPALAAVLLIWLCNWTFVYHLAEVRFYGLLILATSIAIKAAIWVEDRQPSRCVIFLIYFLSNGLLVSAHMLGLVYSTVILLAVIFSRSSVQRRILALSGILSSWLLLLAYMSALKSGAAYLNWILLPGPRDLFRFYFHSPTPQRVVNALLLLFILASFIFCLRESSDWLLENRARFLLLLISVFLMLIPLGFYIVSHIYKPLFADRYMMPYCLGFSCFFACALWLVERQDTFRIHPAYKPAAYVGLFCLILVLHVQNLKQQPTRPFSNIQSLTELNSPLPIVVMNANAFFQLKYYGGTPAKNVVYLLPDYSEGQNESQAMFAISKQGYQPSMFRDSTFLEQHPRFLYPDFPEDRNFYERAIAPNPQWKTRDLGPIQVNGLPIRLLLIEHR
jgi:hypothetical protein